MSQPVFTIILEAAPNHPVPPIVRLRQLLKIAGRALGLKCIAMVEQTNKPPAIQRIPNGEPKP